MSEHERETAFLRHCISYDESPEGRRLAERVTQIQHNERCVRRAVRLMAVLTALALAGLGGSAIYLNGFPHGMSQFIAQFVVKCFCALGAGSLLSLLAFAGLGIVYRRELNQRREECRQLAAKLMASRWGQPLVLPRPDTQGNHVGERNGSAVPMDNEGDGFPVKIESAARG